MTGIEERKLKEENQMLKGEVANFLLAIDEPGLIVEILRLMIKNREDVIAGMFGSSLCVRCEKTLAAESGFVRAGR